MIDTYHVSGSVADRNLTCNTPTSKSASWTNAAFVMSICLDPGVQPEQVSTTRTKTHFFAVLQTTLLVSFYRFKGLLADLPRI